MEAAENFKTYQSVQQVSRAEQIPVSIAPHPPLSEEGFFGPAQQETVKILDESEITTKYVTDVGNVATSLVELTDGSRYVLKKTTPPQPRWDISADFMPPLATRVRGFNTYMARKLAQGGIHNRIIGTNQSQGFTLSHDAKAALAILEHDDRRDEQTCTPQESVLLGYSMGTMKALGLLGQAPTVGRSVHATIGLDPCMAKKVDYHKQLQELPGLLSYLGREAVELGLILGHNLQHEQPARALSRARHFLGTIGLSPHYFRNSKDKWDVVASGETGTFAGDIPRETVLIMHFFKACRFNDQEAYRQLFTDHPNVRIIEEDGYHMSGANPAVVARVVKKTQQALRLVDEKVTPADMASALAYPVLEAPRAAA